MLHCEAIVEGKEDDIDKRSKIVIEIKYLNIFKLFLATIIFIKRMLKLSKLNYTCHADIHMRSLTAN